MGDRLTDVAFWDDFWEGVQLPTGVDASLPFDRGMREFLADVLADESGDVLEVGCAPGKWLAVAHEIAGLRPSGIEFSPGGVSATNRNLELLGIEPGEIMGADFFDVDPAPRFDVVLSLGFVEHFEDVWAVLDRTVAWLRPGGVLVVGVPNFRGVHGFLQRVCDPGVLAAHNLDVMDPRVLTDWADSRDMDVVRAGYLCGFEPGLPVVDTSRRSAGVLAVRGVLAAGRRLRRWRTFDGFDGPRVSAYIAMAARKRGT